MVRDGEKARGCERARESESVRKREGARGCERARE